MKKKKKISKFKEKLHLKELRICFSDIETKIVANEHKLLCIVLLDENNEHKVFYKIENYIDYVLNNKNESIIYFHNFGRFDCMFLLNYLVNSNKNYNVNIIERNNIIYEIKINKVYFRDSLLLIPMSLDKIGENLCKVNKKNKEFNYKEIDVIWNKNKFKVIEQCIDDCKVLKEGFEKFKETIKELFNIDLKENLTLSSLSFNIFKLHHYDYDRKWIGKNSPEQDEFIRRSYKGGLSDVYKPYLKNGYCYDANSLYPTVMRKFKYPVGNGKFVKGSEIDLKNFIGFIECEIETDKNLDFLAYNHKDRGMITPKGLWKDVYYYKEIIKAIELGYKVKIIRGFKYNKEEYIFKSFVNSLYDIRKNSKSSEENNIAKLILNSLYGRFGMKQLSPSTKFIKYDDINELKKNYDIKNIEYLGNNYYIVNYLKKTENEKQLYKNTIDTETAVQIASAITANARIFMYDFKKIDNNFCYYSDTDSLFLEKKLNSKYLGKNLGEFKLEYEIEEAIFIAPKIYYVKKKSGDEKLTLKGLKSEEYNVFEVVEMFKNILKNKGEKVLKIKRLEKFRRDYKNIVIKEKNTEITLSFPFNKRKKILNDENVWIDTEPLSIRIM